MVTFQLFFQSGWAKDMSAPLYIVHLHMPHKVNDNVHLTTMTCFWRFLFRALYKLDM